MIRSRALATAAACIFSAASASAGEVFDPPAHEDLIIYQVFIDRFNNGDPTNDTANPRASFNPSGPTSFHGGDLEGVRQKLPYIAGLGANAIWLSPLLENVNSYHGYGTYNWYNVEPNFGDLAKLKQLVAEAHDLGIAVFFDMVAGHCSDIIDSTNAGYPGYRPPPNTYTLRWRTGLRYPPPFDSLEYFHAHGQIGNFNAPEQELGELSGLDDLKTETPYVQEEMTEIWKYWLREADIDGFRIDTVKHVDLGFWEYFLPKLREEAFALGKSNYFTFGEIYGADDPYMRQYVGTLTGGPYKLDAALDFPFYYTSEYTFSRGTGTTWAIAQRIQNRALSLGAHHLKMPNFIDNHDLRRFLNTATENPGSGLAERQRRLEIALVMMMTSPGPPVIYYGTEQGFDGGHDPYNREDMWDGEFEFGPSIGDNFDQGSVLYRLTARLGRLRNELAPLRRGSFITRRSVFTPGILVFSRIHEGEEVLVVLNTSTQPTTQGAIATTFAQGTVLANALSPNETLLVGVDGVLVDRPVSGQAAEVWVPAELVPPMPPEVVNFSPANNESGVPVNSGATITFSTAMDEESVAANLTLSPHVPHLLSWNDDSTAVNIRFAHDLDSLTRYTVTVGSGALAADGEPLAFAGSASWLTERVVGQLPPLPAPYPALVRTAHTITVNGSGDDWEPVVMPAENTGAVDHFGVFVWKDAIGDDRGPGSYLYPTNSVFTGSDADIDEFRFAFDQDNLYFLLKPASINPAASFFTPYFGIALDTRPGGRTGAFGYDQANGVDGIAELMPRPDAAPDYELVFTGPRGATLLNTDGNSLAGANSAFSQSTGVVEISVPRAVVGLTASMRGRRLHVYVYSGLETFGGLREIAVTRDQWTPGGGIVGTADPDLFDLVGATAEQQAEDFADFAEEYESIVRSSILAFALFDELPQTNDTWILY